jgi:3-methyl-2-oxobutanoate hydroxymethyltransferase
MAKISLKKINLLKSQNKGIASLTAYDASFARFIDDCGIDIILVGDSLGEVIQGNKNTHSVTLDEIIYHTKIVCKGIKRAYLISDMPRNTYKTTKQAIKNAGLLIKESGADMVKIECNNKNFNIIKSLAEQNIPVCAHIGLTPQFISKKKQFRKFGVKQTEHNMLVEQAIFIEKIGAKMLIIECVSEKTGLEISSILKIPVIGIGSGKFCDGQILVLYDLLGISFNGIPKFFNKSYFKINNFKNRVKKFIKNSKSK